MASNTHGDDTPTNVHPSLRFYAAICKYRAIRSYRGKFLAIAFFATHAPLLGIVGWAALHGYWNPSLLAVAVVATVGGTLVSAWALDRLLVPIVLTGAALADYEREGTRPTLPDHFSDHAGRLMAAVNRTISKLERDHNDLHRVAREDWLTGLSNRRAAEEYLMRSIAMTTATGRSFHVAFIDINNFKVINDTFGHAAGDEVLRAVASHLKKALGPDDWLARWAGDEFLIGIAADVEDVAVRIKGVTQPLQTEHGMVNFAVGFVEVDKSLTAADTVRLADAVMYAKKRSELLL